MLLGRPTSLVATRRVVTAWHLSPLLRRRKHALLQKCVALVPQLIIHSSSTNFGLRVDSVRSYIIYYTLGAEGPTWSSSSTCSWHVVCMHYVAAAASYRTHLLAGQVGSMNVAPPLLRLLVGPLPLCVLINPSSQASQSGQCNYGPCYLVQWLAGMPSI